MMEGENMSDKVLPCRFCGGIPIESERAGKYNDCGCFAFIELAYSIKHAVYQDLAYTLEKWNARNEKFNPFIKNTTDVLIDN